MPALLVFGVVAAGAVGHRELQRQFTLIIALTRNVHSDEPNNDNTTFQTRDLAGKLDRVV